MRLKPTLAVSADGFLFDPTTGESFAANALATDIIRRLQDHQSEAIIRADLLARYAVSAPQLAADWDDLVGQLRAFGLLLD